MSQQLENIINALETYTGKPAKRNGGRISCVCTHDGASHYNLSVTDGNDRVLLYCHSHQCDAQDILERAGLSIRDVYFKPLTRLNNGAQQKPFVNDRKLKSELNFELIILQVWLSDVAAGAWDNSGNDTHDRTLLALRRVNAITAHYLKVDI